MSKIPRNHVFRYYCWRFPHSHHRFFLIVLPYLLLLSKSQLIFCSPFFHHDTTCHWGNRKKIVAIMSLRWCEQLTVVHGYFIQIWCRLSDFNSSSYAGQLQHYWNWLITHFEDLQSPCLLDAVNNLRRPWKSPSVADGCYYLIEFESDFLTWRVGNDTPRSSM